MWQRSFFLAQKFDVIYKIRKAGEIPNNDAKTFTKVYNLVGQKLLYKLCYKNVKCKSFSWAENLLYFTFSMFEMLVRIYFFLSISCY